MNVKPLADRILVEPLEKDTVSPGGVIIPDTAKEKPQEGKVLAVGPGAVNDKGQRIPMEIKTGDRVIFSTYAGTEIKLDGKKYYIMKESEVLAVLI
ncbi:MAG: co-chaperone GroES [Peptococcaceae bacterium]|jgi:chaperonin GroES|nr:co-chaperone GroES [Peptococcaceae bacterium]MDH7526328.1 co-chaperone GroES [Peptococcaceae bacterium]